MPRGTPRVSPPLGAQFLCWHQKSLGEYPAITPRHTGHHGSGSRTTTSAFTLKPRTAPGFPAKMDSQRHNILWRVPVFTIFPLGSPHIPHFPPPPPPFSPSSPHFPSFAPMSPPISPISPHFPEGHLGTFPGASRTNPIRRFQGLPSPHTPHPSPPRPTARLPPPPLYPSVPLSVRLRGAGRGPQAPPPHPPQAPPTGTYAAADQCPHKDKGPTTYHHLATAPVWNFSKFVHNKNSRKKQKVFKNKIQKRIQKSKKKSQKAPRGASLWADLPVVVDGPHVRARTHRRHGASCLPALEQGP